MKKFLVLLAMIFSLVGCIGEKAINLKEETIHYPENEPKKIVVYCSRPEDITQAVVDRFLQQHPEYEVEVHFVGGEEALVALDKNKDKPLVDVWWGGAPSELMVGKNQGLFRKIPIDIVELVSQNYQDGDGHWVGEALYPEAFVTAFSTKAGELPWQWEDLIEPEFQGRILLIPPAYDLSSQIWLGTIFYRKGYFQTIDAKNWLLRLDANTREYFVEDRKLVEALITQPGTLTWMDLPRAIRWRDQEKYPLKIYLPQSSQPVFFTGVGLIKEAPHPRGAELFVQFLLSDETQGFLGQKFFQVSAREALPEWSRPSWYEEWNVAPQDIDWEWIAGTARRNLTIWEEQIEGYGIPIPVAPKENQEMPLKTTP